MAVDLHVVGRIEERAVDRLAFADEALQERYIAPVTAGHSVLAQLPDVAGLDARGFGHSRDHLVIGIVSLGQNHVDLSGAEPGKAKVYLHFRKRELGQLELEDLGVPARV